MEYGLCIDFDVESRGAGGGDEYAIVLRRVGVFGRCVDDTWNAR